MKLEDLHITIDSNAGEIAELLAGADSRIEYLEGQVEKQAAVIDQLAILGHESHKRVAELEAEVKQLRTPVVKQAQCRVMSDEELAEGMDSVGLLDDWDF